MKFQEGDLMKFPRRVLNGSNGHFSEIGNEIKYAYMQGFNALSAVLISPVESALFQRYA
jgi:hypothetical protein